MAVASWRSRRGPWESRYRRRLSPRFANTDSGVQLFSHGGCTDPWPRSYGWIRILEDAHAGSNGNYPRAIYDPPGL